MKFTTSVLFVAALQPVLARMTRTNLRPSGNSDCGVLLQDTQFEGVRTEEKFVCEFDDGTTTDIVGDGVDQLKMLKNQGRFKSGSTTVSGCEFRSKGNGNGRPQECFLPPGFQMKVVDDDDMGRKRKLLIGDKTVLVVRVIATNGATTDSEAVLGDSVFGTNDDPVNLKSQYTECSHQKLNFAPAPNKASVIAGANIANGVTTVSVNVATGDTDSVMRPAITNALNAQFGVNHPRDLADYVMYCLPPNTMSGIAYAFINSWNSVYSDKWCTYLSAQMHELGHNINLAHANEGGTYRDQTGMMGFSYSQDDGPKMCFNAAKSWQLGWYSDKHIQVDADGAYSGPLMGIVNYSSNSSPVLVKINTSSTVDYYVNFNRKTGFNSGTVEGGDQVTVVSAGGEGTGYAESELLAKLSANQEYSTSADGKPIKVSVGSIDTTSGIAQVSITFGAQVTPAPTQAPVTPSPTQAPVTPSPTQVPVTPSPTQAPVTPSPTQAPATPSPTPAPVTPSPTPAPITPSPTQAPVTPAPVTPSPTVAVQCSSIKKPRWCKNNNECRWKQGKCVPDQCETVRNYGLCKKKNRCKWQWQNKQCVTRHGIHFS